MRHPLGRVGVWAGRLRVLPASEAIDAVLRFEAAGYDAVWISEGLGKEILSHATLLLAATERVTIATGVANIWARDAVSMRNGVRTITDAFPGRFVAGLGVSHGPMVEARGHDYSRPLASMTAYLDAMVGAPYDGPPTRDEAPVVIGALGPGMLALARDRTQGGHTYAVPVEHTRRARAILGADRLLAPEQGAVLDRDLASARATARSGVRLHLRLPNYRNNLRRLGWEPRDLDGGGSDALIDALVATGGPDAIAERVRDHFVAGADHVAVQLFSGADDPVPVDDLCELEPFLRDAAGQP